MRTHYHAETNRWWLYDQNHRTLLNLEWQWLIKARFRLEIDFRKHWCIKSIALGIPFLFSVYASFGDTDEWAEYELGCYYFERALWFKVFSNPLESNSNDPWYRKTHCLDFADFFLGRTKCVKEEIGTEEVEIPLPERTYHGVATLERYTRKRPLWFKQVRDSVWITVDGGVPFPGKGENSWDCGMDGLYGAGKESHCVEAAVGHFVGVVLRNRRRYGGKNWKVEAIEQ
jgi:hypothetical protein